MINSLKLFDIVAKHCLIQYKSVNKVWFIPKYSLRNKDDCIGLLGLYTAQQSFALPMPPMYLWPVHSLH